MGGSHSTLDSHGVKGDFSKTIHMAFEKVKPGRPVYVLGSDITIDMVSTLLKQALISRFEYVKPSISAILAWVREYWNPVLKSVPKVLTLVNGWVLF